MIPKKAELEPKTRQKSMHRQYSNDDQHVATQFTPGDFFREDETRAHPNSTL